MQVIHTVDNKREELAQELSSCETLWTSVLTPQPPHSSLRRKKFQQRIRKNKCFQKRRVNRNKYHRKRNLGLFRTQQTHSTPLSPHCHRLEIRRRGGEVVVSPPTAAKRGVCPLIKPRKHRQMRRLLEGVMIVHQNGTVSKRCKSFHHDTKPTNGFIVVFFPNKNRAIFGLCIDDDLRRGGSEFDSFMKTARKGRKMVFQMNTSGFFS